MCSFAPEVQAAFDRKDLVRVIQCDLTRDEHIAKAFASDVKFDFVVNLCGETRFGLPEEDYQRKCLTTAIKAGEKAKALGVSKFIEVSTAQVYPAAKAASTEDEIKLEPWTRQARYRLDAEKKLQEMGLPLVILRPAIVYGKGDLAGLTPRIATAAAYQFLEEKMVNLWTGDLKINCVHVVDVVRAIWMACTTFPSGSVFNLADKSDLTQDKMNEMLSVMFGIKTGFMGSLKSMAAEAISLDMVANHANHKHVPAWQKLCEKHAILNTPLSPYIDKELLYNKHLSVDGSKITATGFVYEHPEITTELLREQVTAFISQGLFPPTI